jgi:hypothetical protein
MLALAGAQVWPVRTRPKGPGEDQADAGAPADEQSPPVDPPLFTATRQGGLIEGR